MHFKKEGSFKKKGTGAQQTIFKKLLQNTPGNRAQKKKNLFIFIQNARNSLVVMGAFGRNALSRWMQKSMADVVVKETTAALFITIYNRYAQYGENAFFDFIFYAVRR